MCFYCTLDGIGGLIPTIRRHAESYPYVVVYIISNTIRRSVLSSKYLLCSICLLETTTQQYFVHILKNQFSLSRQKKHATQQCKQFTKCLNDIRRNGRNAKWNQTPKNDGMLNGMHGTERNKYTLKPMNGTYVSDQTKPQCAIDIREDNSVAAKSPMAYILQQYSQTPFYHFGIKVRQ